MSKPPKKPKITRKRVAKPAKAKARLKALKPTEVSKARVSQVSSSTRSIRMEYTSPLPPAVELERYESILPGTVNRVVKMAETEQRIRGSSNKRIHQINLIKIVCSTFVSLSLIGFAVFSIYAGVPLLGGVTIFAGIIASIMNLSSIRNRLTNILSRK